MSAIVPQSPGLALSRTGAQVIDLSLSIEEIGERIEQAAALGDTARWWIGDLLLYAEERWGEEAAQLLDQLRLSERQLTKYRWVAEKVGSSLRRENLSFSHHELVAAMPPVEQERLLATAEAGELSVAAFREAVNDRKAITEPPPTAPSRIVMTTPPPSVDAARGLRKARETLRHVASGSPEAAEALDLPDAIRGIDAAAKIVRRIDPLEEVLVAVSAVIDAGAIQTGLPDPAVIVPSGAWANLVAAHQRATEGRST